MNESMKRFYENRAETKRNLTKVFCPISPKLPTRMTREGFIRACELRRIDTGNWACMECGIRKRIEEGRNFPAPPHIEFLTLSQLQYGDLKPLSGRDFDKEALTSIPPDKEKKIVDPLWEEILSLIQEGRRQGKQTYMSLEIAELLREWKRSHPTVTPVEMAKDIGTHPAHLRKILRNEKWVSPTTGEEVDDGPAYSPEWIGEKIRLRREAGRIPLLTKEIVEEIREWHRDKPEVSQRYKARIIGLSRRQLGRIIKGEVWT